jgi:hypothetical protein
VGTLDDLLLLAVGVAVDVAGEQIPRLRSKFHDGPIAKVETKRHGFGADAVNCPNRGSELQTARNQSGGLQVV